VAAGELSRLEVRVQVPGPASVSFSGTIPAPLRRTVADTVERWPDGDLLFPCCGSLTSERVVAAHFPDRFRLHSSDVNLVSCALGAAAAGERLDVAIAADKRERLGWLDEFLVDGLDVAATTWLAFRYVVHLARSGFVYDRYLAALREQWERMWGETRGRMEHSLPRLASFEPADALDWLRQRPELPVVTYPPFRNATTSYETGDWNMMNKVFEWPEPSFGTLDGDRYAELLDEITGRECFLLGVNEVRPELADKLVMSFQPTVRSPTVNVYASDGTLRVVRPRQPTAGAPWPHLLPGQELGERLAIAPLTFPEFAALRSKYMNKGIRPGSSELAVAVLVDGVLVGTFALMRQAKGIGLSGRWQGTNVGYLLSDFPVAPSDYPRLSKLVLLAALSEESRLLAEQRLNRRFDALLTTAFTNNPTSMKYRGEMQLYTRKPQNFKEQLRTWVQDEVPEWNTYYQRKWDLNYIARWGERTLEEGFELWRRKHGKRVQASGAMPATADR
jgi:DNA adenine methylase-like protein/GNAT domain-containint protein